jgi:hypothetical protein
MLSLVQQNMFAIKNTEATNFYKLYTTKLILLTQHVPHSKNVHSGIFNKNVVNNDLMVYEIYCWFKNHA